MSDFALYDMFPHHCYVGKNLPIELFHKLGCIPPKALKLFDLYFVKATIQFCFQGCNTGILPKSTKNCSYNEILVVEVEIKTRSDGWRRINSFAKTVLETMPSPMLLVIRYKRFVQLYTAEYHNGIVKASKMIVDQLQHTYWIDTEDMRDYDENLIKNIVESMNEKEFSSVYAGYRKALCDYCSEYKQARLYMDSSYADSKVMNELFTQRDLYWQCMISELHSMRSFGYTTEEERSAQLLDSALHIKDEDDSYE